MADRATTGGCGRALLPSDPFERVHGQIMAAGTAAQPATFRPDALSARHPQLAVRDLLVAGVAQRTSQRITH